MYRSQWLVFNPATFIKGPVQSQESEQSCMCVKGIDFASFYDLSVGLCNCSDSVLFCCFSFSNFIDPLISVSVKQFDTIEFSHCLSAPCQLLVWNYLTLLSGFSLCISTRRCQLLVWNYLILLSSLCVYQPGVSCWYKIFDFVEFSHCIPAPC